MRGLREPVTPVEQLMDLARNAESVCSGELGPGQERRTSRLAFRVVSGDEPRRLELFNADCDDDYDGKQTRLVLPLG